MHHFGSHPSASLLRDEPTSSRRSHRLPTQLWFRVDGVHLDAVFGKGDLCATGVYLGMREPPGAPGDIVMLELGAPDRSARVKTLARVARVVRQDDPGRGARVIGAAFEFLPIDQVSPGVVVLLQSVTEYELRRLGSLRIEEHLSGLLRLGPDTSLRVDITSLTSDRVVVHGSRGVSAGTRASLQVNPTVAPTRIKVVVDSSLPEGSGHSLVLRADEANDTQILVQLGVRLIAPQKVQRLSRPSPDLSGDLGRLRIGQVVQFLTDEGYSGVLVAADDKIRFSVELNAGQLENCEASDGTTGRQALQALVELTHGEFKFRCHRSPQPKDLLGTAARLVNDVLAEQPAV